MKVAVFLVTSSLLFGLLGFAVAFAIHQATELPDASSIVTAFCGTTGVGVVLGFLIASYGLRLEAERARVVSVD